MSVSPDAAGEGVETITVTASNSGGTDSEAVDVGFYVVGAHSCFLAQNYDALFNAGKADATAVSTWENLGSSALDVSNTLTLRPTYKTNVKGGQPMIRFDGSNDYLPAATASDWVFLHSGVDSTVQITYAVTDADPNTIFALVTNASALSSGASRGTSIFYDDRAASSREDQQWFSLSNGTALNFALQSANDEVPAQTYSSISAITDDDGGAGHDGFLYVNNVLSVSAAHANAYSSSDAGVMVIGAETDVGRPLKGDIWRVVIYSSALSSTQRGINLAVDEWALNGGFPLAYVPGIPDPTRWAAVGDSITAGAGGITSWPTKLSAYTPVGVTLVVDAVSGGKTFDILNAWRNVQVAGVPSKLFVLGGINNVRTDQTAAEAYYHLARIYDEAADLGVEVIAMQTLPFGEDSAWTSGRQTQLEALMPLIAADGNIDLLVDWYVLMGDPVDLKDILPAYDHDHLHPSEAGTTFMADHLKVQLGI